MSKIKPFVVGGLGAAAFAFLAAGNAHADTVLIPGHSDGDCVGYVDQLGATGQVVPPGTTVDNLPPGVHCANYSAQMAPIGNDTISTEDSTNEGAQRAYDICQNVGGTCTFRGYSEGSIAAAKAQNRELAEGNPNTNLVLDGDAVGSTNILNGPYESLPFIQPVVENPNAPFSVNPNGVPSVPEPPNTERHYSSNDPFANGNQANPNANWSQAVDPGGHAVQDPNAPNVVVWNGPNGETNVETVDPHPFTVALQENNGIDASQADGFFQSVDPVDTNVPAASPLPDVSAPVDLPVPSAP